MCEAPPQVTCLATPQGRSEVTDTPAGLDLPSVSFSPESGGRVKPNRAMEDMRTHGMMRVEK